MPGRELRIRVTAGGCLEVVDPDAEAMALLRSVDPDFGVDVHDDPLETPRLQRTRAIRVPNLNGDLGRLPSRTLWELHDRALAATDLAHERGVSLLELKVELARRALAQCRLCGHRCGVNRLQGELGRCGLGTTALVGEHFLHVREEDLINPAYVLNLRGCALRCRYCQQYKLLNPVGVGEALDDNLWDRIDLARARCLEFVGGNPDESVYAVLRFLLSAPAELRTRIAWNCHGYGMPVVYDLLRGVVDVYVPDFKYGNDSCARTWSGVERYVATARRSIQKMLNQATPVVVRVLVLPGHLKCCHLPVVRWLSRQRGKLVVHVMGQYCPDFRITPRDGVMARRPAATEIEKLREYSRILGLELAD